MERGTHQADLVHPLFARASPFRGQNFYNALHSQSSRKLELKSQDTKSSHRPVRGKHSPSFSAELHRQRSLDMWQETQIRRKGFQTSVLQQELRT
jgi:hypothetical protein